MSNSIGARVVKAAACAMTLSLVIGQLEAATIDIANAGFEQPVLAEGSSTTSIFGWTWAGTGIIVNPTNDLNAYDANVYRSTGAAELSQVVGVLEEGNYTLNVAVGARPAATFGSYRLQLGSYDASNAFVLLKEDVNTASPVPGGTTVDERFAVANLTFDSTTEALNGVNIGDPLVVRLVSESDEVNFDNVALDFLMAPTDVTTYLKTQRFVKSLPDGVQVPMWGFTQCTDNTFSNCAPVSESPGPVIEAYAGRGLTIQLMNTLSSPVSLIIPGQAGNDDGVKISMPTDINRVQSFSAETPANGGVQIYTWPSLKAGTYLYQSGTYPSLQVPMGLYGALAVHQDATQAYPGVSTQAESLLLFSEVDPLQNRRVDTASNFAQISSASCVKLDDYNNNGTAGFPCTIDYKPHYLLVNGAASYDLNSERGSSVLFRFLNAGLRLHSPALIGLDFSLIAEDGNRYPGLARKHNSVALAAGKTIDALATLPDSDITLSLYDRVPSFRNDTASSSEPGKGASLGNLVVGTGSGSSVPPARIVNDDIYAVTEDTLLSVTSASGVLANDVISSPASLTVAYAPSNGSLTLNGDGSFDYTPNPDFSGLDQFVYDADGNLGHVTLDISFENDMPQAAADGPYRNSVGSAINVAAPGVLGNDRDADGDALTAVIEGTAPAGLTLNADGSFSYTGAGATSFSYRATDGTAMSDPVVVELQMLEVSNIALNVHDENGVSITEYRWTVEEDAMRHPDPLNPSSDTLATNFHKSYMPVVAQGVGAAEFAELALDPAKHYYVSVLPLDAANGEAGHTVGGAQILPGATSVSVRVNSTPLPTAQISMFVFNDNAPTNGAVDGQEVGLGNFQVTLEDAGGRYGASAGLLSQDAFGQPLTNALDCFGGQPPEWGIILSCPDTPENRAAGVVGEVLIKNLYPGKYGVITTPPGHETKDWIQTSTIEGTKVIDAWVKAGEPPYFQEFGPAGWHVFVGFVNPAQIAASAPTGGNSIIGQVTNMHMSRPPVQTLYDSGSYDALAHTRAWLSVNSANGTGPSIAVVQAAEDGSFAINGLPDGNYQLAIWDQYLDQVIAYRSFSVPLEADLGNIPVFNWFSRLENTVFLDDGCNGAGGVAGDGIRQECEAGIPEQAVNLRWRDGTLYQSFPTDLEGFVPFDQVFPFFHWQVAEVDFTRFKATGMTAIIDGGGDVSTTGGVLNPQVQADNTNSRTETGPVLTQGFQGFLGQTSVIEWGKAPYAPGENGGISGIVYYASTRAENDPRLGVAEPWEPGVPAATVRLYRVLSKKPQPIDLINGDFEAGALTGWTAMTGTGTVMDPSNNENAYDTYVFRSSGSDLTQILSSALEEGTYTLNAEIGGRPAADFGSYRVQLGVVTVYGEFVVLAEDNNSKLPNTAGATRDERFETSRVMYTAASNDAHLGETLAVRLISTSEVNFDNVRLTMNESGLALVAETTTDSWDAAVPEGCPGAHPDDALITGGPIDKCYDGLRNFNQVRPAVFDGGYAFSDIPPGDYVVELIPPDGYEIVKEEDVNVGFGDTYSVAPASVIFPTGGDYVIPDAAMVFYSMNGEPGLAQPRCVGSEHIVPDYLALFPNEMVEAPFAQASRPLCDRKAVVLPDQGQAAADFFVHTKAPIGAHFVGMVLDDVAQEFNPLSPAFSEKWAPPNVPIAVLDHRGVEISRTYTDQWGRMSGVLPSTFTANMPSPSGYSPAMLMTCINDPGPIPDPNNPSQEIIDPYFNPAYSNFCYTFQYMPGTTTYLDTPVLPVSAFASGDNPPDCELPAATPKIRQVDGQDQNGPNYGPLVVPGGTLTLYSQGLTTVPNPDYSGAQGSEPKTITRDFGFGNTAGTVTLDGSALTVLGWADDVITVQAPATETTGQLMVTRGDNNQATESGITVTVLNVNVPGKARRVIRVPAEQPTIQAAIDAANVNNIVMVAPGTYNELVIMWKPVNLQGAGPGATFINAVKRPTEVMLNWRAKMDCLYGIGAGCTDRIDSLPNQPDGAAGYLNEEGAGITVVAATAGPNRFNGRQSRIDGFAITGGDTGGGIFVNGYAHQLEIANNNIFGNHGAYHGGIRVGRSFMELADDGPYGFNDRVLIHHNIIKQNGALDGAGAGISIATGSDRYNINNNYICGNFTTADGAGIGHLGLSDRGVITGNTIVLNQSFDQAQTRSGGGVFIGGEPPVGAALTFGSGSVTLTDNLIQGNHAAAGHGGGVRTQFVNGTDVAGSANPGAWYTIALRNNIIVNNIAGWSGGGVSLQDTVDGRLVSNTISHNDSTATVGPLVNVNISSNQPGGIASEVHTPGLNAVIPASANNRFKNFSNPILRNNIVWQNRSFHYDAQDGTAKLIPVLSPAVAGGCDGNAQYWDLGVIGTNTYTLNPRFSLLTDTTGYHGSNVQGDAAFVSPYCNGARAGAGPMFPLPAVDEAGATWIDVRFGPLKVLGDYHIGSGSAAIDNANNSAPPLDFDGDTRPDAGLNDIGADENI